MDACTLSAAVTAVANTIAPKLTDEELAIWSAVFAMLGDTLALILAARAASDLTDGPIGSLPDGRSDKSPTDAPDRTDKTHT